MASHKKSTSILKKQGSRRSVILQQSQILQLDQSQQEQQQLQKNSLQTLNPINGNNNTVIKRRQSIQQLNLLNFQARNDRKYVIQNQINQAVQQNTDYIEQKVYDEIIQAQSLVNKEKQAVNKRWRRNSCQCYKCGGIANQNTIQYKALFLETIVNQHVQNKISFARNYSEQYFTRYFQNDATLVDIEQFNINSQKEKKVTLIKNNQRIQDLIEYLKRVPQNQLPQLDKIKISYKDTDYNTNINSTKSSNINKRKNTNNTSLSNSLVKPGICATNRSNAESKSPRKYDYYQQQLFELDESSFQEVQQDNMMASYSSLGIRDSPKKNTMILNNISHFSNIQNTKKKNRKSINIDQVQNSETKLKQQFGIYKDHKLLKQLTNKKNTFKSKSMGYINENILNQTSLDSTLVDNDNFSKSTVLPSLLKKKQGLTSIVRLHRKKFENNKDYIINRRDEIQNSNIKNISQQFNQKEYFIQDKYFMGQKKQKKYMLQDGQKILEKLTGRKKENNTDKGIGNLYLQNKKSLSISINSPRQLKSQNTNINKKKQQQQKDNNNINMQNQRSQLSTNCSNQRELNGSYQNVINFSRNFSSMSNFSNNNNNFNNYEIISPLYMQNKAWNSRKTSTIQQLYKVNYNNKIQ